MRRLSRYPWLCFYFLLFGQNVRGLWPSSNSSAVQLLGIAERELNIENSSSSSFYQTRALFYSAMLLAQQYNITVGGEYLGWNLIETTGDPIIALRATCETISTSNTVGIVGPAVSREAHVIAPFGASINIPTISYSATNPELSDRIANPTFYRTVPSDNDAAVTIANLFLEFNWTMCLIIYQNDEFGTGGAKAISDAFVDSNVTVTETMIFDLNTLSIRGDLKSTLTGSLARIVIVWADTSYATLILQSALKADVVGPLFTWILGSDVPLTAFDEIWYDRLIGVLTIGPVVGNLANAPVNQTLLNDALGIWQKYEPESFPGTANVDYYALFAFDATWTLIQSFAQLCPNSTVSSCITFTNTSFCFDRRVLNIHSIFDIINTNTFLGVTGPVQFSTNKTDRVNGTYYIVKNVQRVSSTLKYVPVLISTNSAAWTPQAQANVIIWPGHSLAVPTGYASLQGVTLHIAIILTAPFTMMKEYVDQNGIIQRRLTGYIPDLIDHLQQKMGFVPNITVLPENITYNSLPDLVASNVYDLVVGDVTIMASRRTKAAFSDSIFDNSLRIMTRQKTEEEVHRFGFLRTFELRLWMVILGCLAGSACLFFLYEGRVHTDLRNRSILSRIGMSIWLAFGTLIGYGADFHTSSAPGRVLTIGIYITSLVLISAYQAYLTASITVSIAQSSFSGIDDIKNGKVAYNRIGIISGSSIEDYFLREISDGSRTYYVLRDKQDMLDKLLSGIIDVSIMDTGFAEFVTNSMYCNLTIIGAGFDQSEFGIIYPTKWLYEQALDVTILSLRESGVFDDLKSKWFQTNNCTSSSTDTPMKLTLGALAGLFIVFAVVSALSMLMFLWVKRRALLRYVRRRRSRNAIALNPAYRPYAQHLPYIAGYHQV
ncbi:unnamed protein product [Adineta ricciae]|uniref:Ionotropic glutamate receptor C-terminal domain-containing protein n=1 Tax=Adineta ricciae TaxID=249248 RepID=A0A815GSJ1_ADIRI|nr:unnamed protein product [Adineta ricciae]CAF1494300.1 unnamed protein product [Adineta ricciae]